ncbi:DNA polymerase III subunit beta [Corynebacterium atypicum]|uniref:Beta sliding clamp n=1 Tax=Corynebacterium atypicum TaxID=191610 RepID=A0ABM5QKF3_9CORY|nr:DNA polymerase III subunit beta [Corynebacterium atypicum]AIG63363.1 DNA polymerase III subunit beta [Corynebacterium atypicum]
MESQDVAFRVDKSDLTDAVSWVARSLPSKAAQPVLRAMVITAGDEGLEIAGFDYEVSTRVRLAAEVETPGTIAVAGKLIADITATLPAKPVELRVSGSALVMSCGASRFELPLIPLDDYPKLPDLPEVTGRINPALFAEAVNQVAVAAGRDDTLPMLTGVCVDIHGSRIEMAATDRFRLARRVLEWEPTDQSVEARLLIPAKTLQDNARTLDTQLNDPIEVAVGTGDGVGAQGLFGVHAYNRQTTTRMLDSEFPTIDPLLPQTHTSLATVEIAPLLEAIRRVSLVTDRNAQIRMQFSPGELILSAGGTDSGHAEERLSCAFTGQEELLIAFNPNYLKDGLGVVHTDRVVFGFNDPARPAILVPEPDELPEVDAEGNFSTPARDFTYLLMPVRLPG